MTRCLGIGKHGYKTRLQDLNLKFACCIHMYIFWCCFLETHYSTGNFTCSNTRKLLMKRISNGTFGFHDNLSIIALLKCGGVSSVNSHPPPQKKKSWRVVLPFWRMFVRIWNFEIKIHIGSLDIQSYPLKRWFRYILMVQSYPLSRWPWMSREICTWACQQKRKKEASWDLVNLSKYTLEI